MRKRAGMARYWQKSGAKKSNIRENKHQETAAEE